MSTYLFIGSAVLVVVGFMVVMTPRNRRRAARHPGPHYRGRQQASPQYGYLGGGAGAGAYGAGGGGDGGGGGGGGDCGGGGGGDGCG